MKLSISLQLLRSIGQSEAVGRTLWTGDQLVARPLYLYTNTGKRTHNTNTKHPRPEWDSCLRPLGYCDRLASERAKTVHALDRSATVPASVRASEDSSCFRPLGYRDRRYSSYLKYIEFIGYSWPIMADL
jgi:hypothetical protein